MRGSQTRNKNKLFDLAVQSKLTSMIQISANECLYRQVLMENLQVRKYWQKLLWTISDVFINTGHVYRRPWLQLMWRQWWCVGNAWGFSCTPWECWFTLWQPAFPVRGAGKSTGARPESTGQGVGAPGEAVPPQAIALMRKCQLHAWKFQQRAAVTCGSAG